MIATPKQKCLQQPFDLLNVQNAFEEVNILFVSTVECRKNLTHHLRSFAQSLQMTFVIHCSITRLSFTQRNYGKSEVTQ